MIPGNKPSSFTGVSPYLVPAVVVDVEDPDNSIRNKNRVRVRIPSLHGAPSTNKELAGARYTEKSQLPWAQICYPVGTKSQDKSILGVGDIVFVTFSMGDYRYPIIVGSSGAVLPTEELGSDAT